MARMPPEAATITSPISPSASPAQSVGQGMKDHSPIRNSKAAPAIDQCQRAKRTR